MFLVTQSPHLLHGVLVLPVEIRPGQVAPGVAHDDAVRVEHGDNLEDEQPPESFSSLGVAGQVV